MRRFKIGSARALVWVAVSLAVWCGSNALASAQTFDFTFSGSGATITDGILVLSGGNVTNVSGTLSGVSPSADNGSMSLLTSLGGTYTSSNSYDFGFVVNTSPGLGEDDIVLNPGTNESSIFPDGGGVYAGTATVTEQMTPAPIPGSGPLSYLAFGLGGLFINRKRLWRTARKAVRMTG